MSWWKLEQDREPGAKTLRAQGCRQEVEDGRGDTGLEVVANDQSRGAAEATRRAEAGLSRPHAAEDGRMIGLPLLWCRSGWAAPALRATTAAAKRAYQPAGDPPNGTETL
jgi:hypothetical protein